MCFGSRAALTAGLFAASLPLLAAEQWTVVRSPNFELFTTSGEGAGREAVRYFEQVRSFFREVAASEMQPSRRIRLVGFRSEKEFQPYRNREFGRAYYARGHDQEYIVMSRLGADVFPVAVHEYCHLLVEHSGMKLPLWLNEGLAELYSTLKPLGGQLSVGQLPPGPYELVRSRKLLDLATLTSVDHKSRHYRDKDLAQLFYAQSWALTHMLELSPDYRPRMSDFLSALHSGVTQQAAFEQAFGKSFDQIQKDLEAYLRRDSLFQALFKVKLEKVAEDPEVRVADRLETGLLLAGLLAATRKQKEAEQAYTQLAQEFPQRWEVPEALAYLALGEGSREGARSHFARAVQLGNTNPKLYIDYALLLSQEPGSRSEAIPLLEKAVALKPDSVDARYYLGVFLTGERKYREALSHLQGIKQVSSERAYSLFRSLAFVHYQLADFQAARIAAERARQHARTPEDISSAEEFLRFVNTAAEGRLRPALTAPGFGLELPEGSPPRLGRQPAEDAKQIPSEVVPERPTEVARGTFFQFDCLGKTARLRILSEGRQLAFAILDPQSVIIKGANPGAMDLACGPQKPRPIVLDYYRQEDPKLGTVGVVVALEFP
jgi:tetratricopeptide (TPR) repeat protein